MNPNLSCCPKPSINSMMKPPDVNAVCLSCGVHWYGVVGKVRRYTRQEWDALMLEPISLFAEVAQ